MSMSRVKTSEITKDYVILHYSNRTEVVKIKDALQILPAEYYENKFDLANRVAEIARSLVGNNNFETGSIERDAFIVLSESCKSYDAMYDLAKKWGVIEE